MNAENALDKLMDGNKRFISGDLKHPNHDPKRRNDIKGGQEPFAAVLTCSDSRTPPEIIFDRGLGDLFIVRTAGNIADEVALGSLELAVAEFSVPIIMVLGHQNCGAIKLALEETEREGNIGKIMELIKFAVDMAKELPGNIQDNTAKENVKNVVNILKESSEIISTGVKDESVKIIGAYYWFDDGRVEIID